MHKPEENLYSQQSYTPDKYNKLIVLVNEYNSLNTTLYSTTCQGLGKKDTAKTFLTEVYGVLRNVFFSEDAESIVIRLPGKDVWQY